MLMGGRHRVSLFITKIEKVIIDVSNRHKELETRRHKYTKAQNVKAYIKNKHNKMDSL